MDDAAPSSPPDPSLLRLTGPDRSLSEGSTEASAERSTKSEAHHCDDESHFGPDDGPDPTENTLSFSLRDTESAPQSESLADKLFGRLSQVAMIVCLLGLGYIGAAHLLSKRPSPQPEGATSSITQAAGQRDTIESLRQEIHALKQDVDRLNRTVSEDASEMQGLRTTIARQTEAGQKHASENQTTAANNAADSVTAIAKNAPGKSLASGRADHPVRDEENRATAKQPALISSWVVRDVYQGIALVEGKRGALQVARGEIIPGAGRVQSIEKRGQGWVIITSQGLVDTARD